MPEADVDEDVSVEREALALDVDLAAAAHDGVDLFLPVLGMVVLGIAVGVRRQVDHLHPERRSLPAPHAPS